MLKVYSLAALLAMGGVTAPLFAQEEVKNTTAVQSNLVRGYIRPSLTVAFVTDGSSAAQQALQELQQQSTEQFYFNKVDLPVGTVKLTDLSRVEREERMKQYAESLFKSNHVGQGIMECWFPKFDAEQGGYTLDVIAQRGAYGATDSDVLVAEASKLGKSSMLMSLGERMIDRSYVQVVFLGSERGEKHVTVTFNSVIYKLDFGAEVRTIFYEKGYGERNGISKVEFPLNFVGATKEVEMEVTDKESGLANKLLEASLGSRCTTVADAYDELLTRMSQVNADFQVKTPLADIHPIRAKIGKKEGLKVDDRYYVMDQELKPDGTTKDVRHAIVRVSRKIADNRKEADGHSEDYTRFYQVGGWSYDRGMTLVQKKDIGMSFNPMVSNNFAGLEIEQRISRLVKLPGTFVYARVGLPLGSKALDGKNFGPVKFDYTTADGTKLPGTLLTWGIGLRKQFSFARMFNIAGHVGFNGYYMLTSGELLLGAADGSPRALSKDLGTFTINGGVRLGVQVAPALGFFVGADYGYSIGDNKDLLTKSWEISEISGSFGVRISF